MDHPSHPFIPSYVFLWCQFAAFTYVINHFISVTTRPTLAILQCISNFYYNMIGSNGIILCCCLNWLIRTVVRMFINDRGDWSSISGWVIPKTQKMVLDASKGKWSYARKGVVPSPTPQYSSSWKGSLQVTLKYSQPTYLFIKIDSVSLLRPPLFSHFVCNFLYLLLEIYVQLFSSHFCFLDCVVFLFVDIAVTGYSN